MARTTINDIARIAGYSKTTVSFAFNDPSRIGKETREKILRIADELGYIPDPVARNLTIGRLGTIGLLLPEVISFAFYNPYHSQIVQGIGEICEQEGHSLTLIPPIRESLLEGVRGAVVDGLITLGLEPGTETVEIIRRRHLPFVSIDGHTGGGFPVVRIDDRSASRRIMQHLLELGHRHLAIVAFGPEAHMTADSNVKNERLVGYRDAIREFDPSILETTVFLRSPPSMDKGAEVANMILADHPEITAVVAMSDIIALGIIQTLQEAGKRIPEDISIVGFDDIPQSVLIRPRLTTVSQPGYLKGKVAAQILFRLIQGEETSIEKILDFTLAIRETTCAV